VHPAQLECGNQSRRRQGEQMLMKRAPGESGWRLLMVSSRRHNSISRHRSGRRNELARLLQQITGSPKVDKGDHPGKRHRHGRNNLWRNNISGSGVEFVGRFCETPTRELY
jgi:hypothetical protein